MSRLSGAVLAILILHSSALCPVAVAAGPDASSDSDEGGSVDVYLALGAAAVVGGLLLLDILGDDDDGGTDEAALVPTGVDWSSVEQEVAVREVSVAVAGTGLSADEVKASIGGPGAPAGLVLYPDLLELGDAGGAEKYAMASGFFGIELLVIVPADGSQDAVEVYSAGGLEWSGPAAGVADAVWYICTRREEE